MPRRRILVWTIIYQGVRSVLIANGFSKDLVVERSSARNIGGSPGTPRADRKGGYYTDVNGNGLQEADEPTVSWTQVSQYYGRSLFSTGIDVVFFGALLRAIGSANARTLYGSTTFSGYQFIEIDKQGNFFVPYTDQQLDPAEYLTSFSSTKGNGPGDPPSFLSRLASFLPDVDFDLNVGVGPALGVEILGQKVEANLATFSIFNKKLSYSNGTFNSSKSTVFQEGRVTQGIAVPFAGIQREQVVGDPNAQVDSYTLGIRTEHFDSNGKSIGQKLSSGWGISLIFTLQFEISIH